MSSQTPPTMPRNAVLIGGVNRDITSRFHQKAMFLAESHPAIIARHDGGVARNIAEVLGRLGIPTSLIGAFGDDAESRAMATHLISKNVDLSHAVFAENCGADTFIAVHDHKGELVTAMNQMTLIEMITPRYVEAKSEVICHADFVICDCNLSSETLQAIASMNRNGALVIDAVSAAKIPKITGIESHIDILKLSRNEAIALCDAPPDTTIEALIHLLGARGITQLLISDGANGFAINDGDTIHHLTAISTQAQSVTGAGDCLLGGYIYGLATGHNVLASSGFGRQAAYLSTRTIAAIPDDMSADNITPSID